jgi:hypothetical protein
MSKAEFQAENRESLFDGATLPKDYKKPGRKTDYYPERCEEVIAQGRKGDFPVQMASAMGVCPDTLYEWAKVYPEFAEAFRDAKIIANSWWLDLGRANVHNKDFNTALYAQVTRTQRGSLGYNGEMLTKFKDADDFQKKLAVIDEYLASGAINIPEAERLYGLVSQFARIVEVNVLAKEVFLLKEARKEEDEEAKKSKNKKG